MFYYVWTIGMLFLGIFGLWIIMLYKEDTQEQFRNYPAVTKIPNILPPNPYMRDAVPRRRNIVVEGYTDKVRR